MLTSLYSNPAFVRFYERDLSRVCLWVGLFAASVYLVIFLLPVLNDEGLRLSLLSPFNSDFLAGIMLILISFALSRESPAVPTLFMVLGILVAGQYVRVSAAAGGITGPVPVSLIGNLVITLELLVIMILYIYSVKRIRDASHSD